MKTENQQPGIHEIAHHQALWIPSWHELDQPLTVGEFDRFWFFRQVPFGLLARPEVQAYLRDKESQIEFVFFNSLPVRSSHEVRYARVVGIEHELLGDIRQIKTDGLDYIIFPIDGQPITVEAEESPGSTTIDEPDIDDWTMRVTLAEVSEPVSE